MSLLNKLQPFKHYLESESLAESTIAEHLRNIERFILWAKENNRTGIDRLSYNELLTFVGDMKEKGLTTSTINIRLCSIRKYYEHLKQEGIIELNPARKIHIKGGVKKIVVNPLTYAELEAIYHHYLKYIEEKPIREAKQKQVNLRRKVWLGLLIWQGLHSGEMEKLEIQDIRLSEGIICVPGANSQSRELKLEPLQIIPLHEYLGSLPPSQLKLLPDAHNDTNRFIQEVKGINPLISNAGHIRSSVILHWLKMYSKRQVQYMIGHKWVSSTEHYEMQELSGLTDLLEKHHPFS